MKIKLIIILVLLLSLIPFGMGYVTKQTVTDSVRITHIYQIPGANPYGLASGGPNSAVIVQLTNPYRWPIKVEVTLEGTHNHHGLNFVSGLTYKTSQFIELQGTQSVRFVRFTPDYEWYDYVETAEFRVKLDFYYLVQHDTVWVRI